MPNSKHNKIRPIPPYVSGDLVSLDLCFRSMLPDNPGVGFALARIPFNFITFLQTLHHDRVYPKSTFATLSL